MIDNYPDVVSKLASYKGPNGKQLFSVQDISDILYNCKNTIETNPERIFKILDNPSEIKFITSWDNKAVALWKALYY